MIVVNCSSYLPPEPARCCEETTHITPITNAETISVVWTHMCGQNDCVVLLQDKHVCCYKWPVCVTWTRCGVYVSQHNLANIDWRWYEEKTNEAEKATEEGGKRIINTSLPDEKSNNKFNPYVLANFHTDSMNDRTTSTNHYLRWAFGPGRLRTPCHEINIAC